LESFRTETKSGHTGKQYNLAMKAFVNGKQVSEGNVAQMDWTFAEIIERVSYGVDVFPGDVIGSGTVGTGCFLELNGTGLLNDKNYQPQWLQDGDEIVLEIDALGRLENKIVKADTDYSIIALNKEVEGAKA
jgi:fumarylacetoacetate (FAA) hydrolase